jgi:Na+/proline symporter
LRSSVASADDEDVADLIALVILVALAIIPYNYGTGRWSSEWTQTTRGVGLLIFMIFLPWFVVAIAFGADEALVPVAMVLLVGAWGVGYLQHWQRARRDR